MTFKGEETQLPSPPSRHSHRMKPNFFSSPRAHVSFGRILNGSDDSLCCWVAGFNSTSFAALASTPLISWPWEPGSQDYFYLRHLCFCSADVLGQSKCEEELELLHMSLKSCFHLGEGQRSVCWGSHVRVRRLRILGRFHHCLWEAWWNVGYGGNCWTSLA